MQGRRDETEKVKFYNFTLKSERILFLSRN